MSIGPVEYLVIGFPGSQFNGDVVPALAELVDSGTVRIIDLVFISKDLDGNILSFEYDGLEGAAAAYADLEGTADGLFSEEDVLEAAELIAPGSSAALLLWEDLWATRFAEAVRGSGGQIVAGSRVPHELVQAALDFFESAT
jgi:uncharacterized membrane protein